VSGTVAERPQAGALLKRIGDRGVRVGAERIVEG